MKPLVFLHGWAQSRQIWCKQFEAFGDALFLNLPGHGGAADMPVDAWVDAIVEQLPDEPCLLIGWSLGGMLALQIAATYPERVAQLALISTTPRFRASHDWPHGSNAEVFEGFRDAVESGTPKSLNRFFMLMLHGDEISRSAYNQLAREAVDREKRVTQAGLQSGLELLEHLDLREQVKKISQPTLVIHGENDVIVPVEAGQWLAGQLSDRQQLFFSACGHAPFLTQPEQFNSILQTWWQSQ
ncbi:pimeloyl-[acyl-carrier protein] methyl ester esterase [Mariprofundus micogutta]|uniref:Pimeloyl-[acyl-carrier protein] methyl ester esterase n=1 Tax=Mariprofundus micogutta TaxID=1921010 RepID=A0A1L8CQ34_9PROT|nr:alpha/beta fold hydrolase [Mariprofundus micogutta]GAV21028.1 pimeloyl-[acyl-carrier protein] methyl ester esterase [Mariprofundus micogutta]